MKRNDPLLDRRSFTKDQMVITEGEQGNVAYLIQSGELMVFSKKNGSEIELARLQAGQFVGEMALIFDGPRTASVRATVDSNLIAISRPHFESKLNDSDPTIRAIIQMLSKRIIDANKTVLNKKNDLKDLKDTVRTIYQNVSDTLPTAQQWTLQNTVLPHLKSLMEAIDAFNDRYYDGKSNT